MSTNKPVSAETDFDDNSYHWQRHPRASQIVGQLVRQFSCQSPFAERLRLAMRDHTGTRLIDWLDHIGICQDATIDGVKAETALVDVGFVTLRNDRDGHWLQHRGGLFPAVVIGDDDCFRLAIKVDCVDAFLKAHQMQREITGQAGSPFRKSLVGESTAQSSSLGSAAKLFVCQRHGWTNWQTSEATDEQVLLAGELACGFQSRPRQNFDSTKQLIQGAVAKIGADWACDLFLSAEREYWQNRNQAARIQRERQDRLGLGWGNHDHHTYRSSRAHFAELIECLELFGFVCRERFYAGGQAGWGAQVLEQTNTGIVIFADVDLSPEELTVDFSHDGLQPNPKLGTVGLWCQLHGEAFLKAGMHHLECQFDFDVARRQLAELGIETMEPFTDFPHLRQAFTRGEIWPVASPRIQLALQEGWITRQQAESFERDGAVGSHLEILERNDGFKGFNQTGVSEIIRKTDPRHSQSRHQGHDS
ncbi:hypothetical protein [Planctomycetes bacterium K23_9]|uniref:Uncharacterized protein n=1 Tax=Stieleria marina TaxID=1930275 RepID=A0A517NQ37_9BACT|nr:hypothetical protein K239x_11780 [Planctomycetes bacterium K23_9]